MDDRPLRSVASTWGVSIAGRRGRILGFRRTDMLDAKKKEPRTGTGSTRLEA